MVIDFEQFKDYVMKKYGSLYTWEQKNIFTNCYNDIYFTIRCEEEYVESSVIVSGCCGGSWTGSSSEHFVNEGVDPNSFVNHMVKEIILNYNPNISYFKYMNFMDNKIERFKSREHEYYGNYNDIAECRVKLVDLYDLLKDG